MAISTFNTKFYRKLYQTEYLLTVAFMDVKNGFLTKFYIEIVIRFFLNFFFVKKIWKWKTYEGHSKKKRLLVYILEVKELASCMWLSSGLPTVVFRSSGCIPRRRRKLGVKTRFFEDFRSILVCQPLTIAFNYLVDTHVQFW